MTIAELSERAWTATVSRTIAYFPTAAGTALLILAGWLVSLVVSVLTRRLLRRLDIDERLRAGGFEAGLSSSGLERPASEILSRLVFWLLMISFLVLALENLGLRLSDLPIERFVAYVPRVIGALVLLLAGILLATFLGHGASAGLAGMGIRYHERVGTLVRWVFLALTAVVTVAQLGFDIGLLTGLFTNLVTIVAAALGLAFAWGGREVARNVLAGYYVKESLAPGVILSVEGREGRLEEIGTMSSRLSTEEGSLLVPNSRLVEQIVETKNRARQ